MNRSSLISNVIYAIALHYLLYALTTWILNWDSVDMISVGVFSQYIVLVLLVIVLPLGVMSLKRGRFMELQSKTVLIAAIVYHIPFILSGDLHNWMLKFTSSPVNLFFPGLLLFVLYFVHRNTKKDNA